MMLDLGLRDLLFAAVAIALIGCSDDDSNGRGQLLSDAAHADAAADAAPSADTAGEVDADPAAEVGADAAPDAGGMSDASTPDAAAADTGATDVDDSASACEKACARTYGECGLFLLYADASKVAQDECVAACEDGYFANGPECILATSCDKEELNNSCIAVSPEQVSVASSDPANWPQTWATMERQVLALVNLHRRHGWTCGGTSMPAQGRLALDDRLNLAARGHVKDMVVNDFYSHTGSDGSSPGQRMQRAGYSGWSFGEAINRYYGNPFTAVKSWMESASHCARIMRSEYTDLGVGYAPDGGSQYGDRWTMNFGASN